MNMFNLINETIVKMVCVLWNAIFLQALKKLHARVQFGAQHTVIAAGVSKAVKQ